MKLCDTKVSMCWSGEVGKWCTYSGEALVGMNRRGIQLHIFFSRLDDLASAYSEPSKTKHLESFSGCWLVLCLRGVGASRRE